MANLEVSPLLSPDLPRASKTRGDIVGLFVAAALSTAACEPSYDDEGVVEFELRYKGHDVDSVSEGICIENLNVAEDCDPEIRDGKLVYSVPIYKVEGDYGTRTFLITGIPEGWKVLGNPTGNGSGTGGFTAFNYRPACTAEEIADTYCADTLSADPEKDSNRRFILFDPNNPYAPGEWE